MNPYLASATAPPAHTTTTAAPAAAPIATARQQVATDWSTRFLGATITACLVVSPIGAIIGTLAWNNGTRPALAAPAPQIDRSGEHARAGEFAIRVVTTWLAATQDDPAALAALVPANSLGSLAEVPFTVTDPAVAGINDAGGIWSVTVAATVTDATGTTTRRYYQVPVVVTGTQVNALTLPTPVTGPAITVTGPDGYPARLDTTSPVADAVIGFLTAYLAGSGDVARYTTPGAPITPITPAPYTAVELTDLAASADLAEDVAPADGQTTRLLVTATATVTDDQSTPVAYALTMTARAGRWETTAIDPVPATTVPTPTPTSPSAVPTGTAPTP